MSSKKTIQIEATLEWVESAGGYCPEGGYVRVLVPGRLDPILTLTSFRTRKDAEQDPTYGPAALLLFQQNRPLADDEYLTSDGNRNRFIGTPSSDHVRVRSRNGNEWLIELVNDAWATREAFERAKAYHAKHYKPPLPEPSPFELRLVVSDEGGILAGTRARFHSPTREGYSIKWADEDRASKYKIGPNGVPNAFYDQWPAIQEWHRKIFPPEFDPVDPFGLGKKGDVLVGGWQPISMKPERGRRVVFYGLRTTKTSRIKYTCAWTTRFGAVRLPTWATHWTYAPEVKP